MQTTTKVLSLVVVAVLLGLTVTAAISFHSIQTLSLPISKAAAICTIILPLLTGLSLRGGHSLARQSQSLNFPGNNSPTSGVAILIFTLFTIYETIIATLSITHMAPAAALTCPLDQQWQRLWSGKDALAIRTIQDRHHCCGLHSVVDRPWPFPNKNRPVTACRDTLGRGESCLGYWRRDVRVGAGLLLLVAVVCFVIKVVGLFYLRSRATGTGWRVQRGASGNGKDGRRAIGGDPNGTPYRDDPEADAENRDENPKPRKAITAAAGPDASGTVQPHGPVVQASGLHEGQGDRNAWA